MRGSFITGDRITIDMHIEMSQTLIDIEAISMDLYLPIFKIFKSRGSVYPASYMARKSDALLPSSDVKQLAHGSLAPVLRFYRGQVIH